MLTWQFTQHSKLLKAIFCGEPDVTVSTSLFIHAAIRRFLKCRLWRIELFPHIWREYLKFKYHILGSINLLPWHIRAIAVLKKELGVEGVWPDHPEEKKTLSESSLS